MIIQTILIWAVCLLASAVVLYAVLTEPQRGGR